MMKRAFVILDSKPEQQVQACEHFRSKNEAQASQVGVEIKSSTPECIDYNQVRSSFWVRHLSRPYEYVSLRDIWYTTNTPSIANSV